MATQRVVQYLLDKNKISQGQLKEAQRTQQFFGGQLASHLLKLGFVDEAMLGEALTEVTGVPYAPYDKLRAIPVDVQGSVPADLLEKHRVCPLQREGRTLRLAMLNPRDAVAIKEIEASTGLSVEPWVTSEFRLYQALERHYRIRPQGMRALSLAPPSEMRRQQLSERSEAPDAAPREAAEEQSQVGLDGLPLHADLGYEAQLLIQGDSELDPRPADPATTAPTEPRATDAAPAIQPPATTATRPWADRLQPLEAALATAPDRDAVARALLDFCAAYARRVALFAVGTRSIRGISGRGRSFDDETLRGLTLATGDSTIFDTALQSRDFYFGVVPSLPANRDLYSNLGGRIPPTVLLLPIRVRERVVALLYMDNDTHPLSQPNIKLMRRVAAKAALAFEILILRKKLHEL